MRLEMWMIIVLAWTITSLLVAIAFGHMSQTEDKTQDEALTTGYSPGNVKYFRRQQREATVRVAKRAHATPADVATRAKARRIAK